MPHPNPRGDVHRNLLGGIGADSPATLGLVFGDAQARGLRHRHCVLVACGQVWTDQSGETLRVFVSR